MIHVWMVEQANQTTRQFFIKKLFLTILKAFTMRPSFKPIYIGTMQYTKSFLIKFVFQYNRYWGLQFHGFEMRSLRTS